MLNDPKPDHVRRDLVTTTNSPVHPNPAVKAVNDKEISLPKEKTCSCGRPHNVVPIGALLCHMGYYWWECECKSSMITPKV